jgi:hypothetical protein
MMVRGHTPTASAQEQSPQPRPCTFLRIRYGYLVPCSGSLGLGPGELKYWGFDKTIRHSLFPDNLL